MKKFARYFIVLILLILSLTFGACAKSGHNSTTKSQVKAILSKEILDGKVANFTGAKAIALQNKDSNAKTASISSVKKMTANSNIKQSENDVNSNIKQLENDVNSNIKQSENEFVKINNNDNPVDIKFHTDINSYKQLTSVEHHHNGVKCEITDCNKVSDETIEKEKKLETVITLGGRVNKLYSVGKFTFINISAELNGYLKTTKSNSPMTVKINGVDVTCESNLHALTTLEYSINNVKKIGYVPLKLLKEDANYKFQDYWNDDLNQSFIIDNSTGKTYSLSELGYIQSVENGVIKAGGKFYVPNISDDTLNFLERSVDKNDCFGSLDYVLVDKFGNVVIKSPENNIYNDTETAVNEYTLKENRNILVENKNDKFQQFKTKFIRYHIGSDGLIYRITPQNLSFSSVEVKVLDENCKWQNVPATANATFSWNNLERNIYSTGFVREIKDGKLFLENSFWNYYNEIFLYQPSSYLNWSGMLIVDLSKSEDNTNRSFTANGVINDNKNENDFTYLIAEDTYVVKKGNNIYRVNYINNTDELLWQDADFAPENKIIFNDLLHKHFVKISNGYYIELNDQANITREPTDFLTTPPELKVTLYDDYFVLVTKLSK